MNTNNISLQALENEFISLDTNKSGEIELDPFIKVFIGVNDKFLFH